MFFFLSVHASEMVVRFFVLVGAAPLQKHELWLIRMLIVSQSALHVVMSSQISAKSELATVKSKTKVCFTVFVMLQSDS